MSKNDHWTKERKGPRRSSFGREVCSSYQRLRGLSRKILHSHTSRPWHQPQSYGTSTQVLHSQKTDSFMGWP